MIARLLRIHRKFSLIFSFFITRKLVVSRHPDGSPEMVIRYRGDERFIREISRIKYPPKENPNQ